MSKKIAEIVSVIPSDVAEKFTQVENGVIIITPLRRYDLRTISLEEAAEIVATEGCTHLEERKQIKK